MDALTIHTAQYNYLATLLAFYEHLNLEDLTLPPADELEAVWNEILRRRGR